MASMEELGVAPLWRIAGVADPGSGKSGAIASVINTGRYNLRVLNLDGNTRVLFTYIKREFWKNVDIQDVEEKLTMADVNATIEAGEHAGKLVPLTANNPMPTRAVGYPKAIRRVWQLLDDWPGLGPVASWGPRDILMIDSATPIIAAIERKIKHVAGHMVGEGDFRDQQQINAEFMSLFERLKSHGQTPCNVYATFHRKLIGPKPIDTTSKKPEPELNRELKERAAELVPTRLFPNAPGQAVSPVIGGMFDTLIGFEAIHSGQFQGRLATRDNPIRLIRTTPLPEMDIKLPATDAEGRPLPSLLPLETGLLTIIEAFERNTGVTNE